MKEKVEVQKQLDVTTPSVDQEKARINQNLKFKRDKDREMVRGIFRFTEIPHGQMEFMFKKYKQDPLEKFSFVDGETYTIPLGVAKHLNTGCWYPTYSYKQDESGRPTMGIGEKVRRCTFQSLEFIDINDDIGTALPK